MQVYTKQYYSKIKILFHKNKKIMSHSVHANKLINAHDIKEYFIEYNALFTELYNKLVARVKDKMDDTHNFMTFVIEAIVLLKQEADTLHGYEKKELAIDMVKSIIDGMNISDEEKQELKDKVFPSLGSTIDALIAAAKGYLFLQKVQNNIEQKCNTKCFVKSKKSNTKANVKSLRSGEATIEAPQSQDGTVDVTKLSNIVYDELRALVINKQITVANIISIVTLAMQLVQQFAGVSGANKKKIVVNVINRIVGEFPMSDADRAAVQAIVATTLDQTIDFIVGVANGDIDLIGMVEDGVARCKTMCCK